MDKLQQLYQKRDTFLEFGQDAPEELSRQIKETELEVLKCRLMPMIERAAIKKIPALGLDKDVIVAFKYKGRELASIGTSTDADKMREFNVVCDVAKKGAANNDDATANDIHGRISTEPAIKTEPERAAIKKQPAKGLCVFLPNGDIIQDRDTCSTMVRAIQHAGLMNVAQLNIMLDKLNLVSREINLNRASQQHYAGDGFYINTHCNTATKKRLLDRISSLLNLGWTVEIIDKGELPCNA